MTPERCRHIESLFLTAIRLDPNQRVSFLVEACGDDHQLRAEVESLLAADGGAGQFLEAPAAEVFAELVVGPRRALPVGERIGAYRLLRVVASGGMGTVYEAEQDRPKRSVALKLLHSGLGSPDAVRRFEYESQILGRLRHAGIAQVYEAGMLQVGAAAIPYFAMEYLPAARPISRYAEQHQLALRERLALFCSVCEAVHYGHQRGVIHRDLKPENILVDRHGNIKVIDFGVARSIDGETTGGAAHTARGTIVGTLQYMSPEQCDGDPHNLDARADVYSLGMVLYRLLCGEVAYRVGGMPITAAARIIREVEPRRPSAIRQELRGDLETILLKALQKDRTRRYASVAELQRDIERYLARRPIEARPLSKFYVAQMFVRRNKPLAAAIAGALLILVGATVVSTLFAVRAERARRVAIRQRRAAVQQRAQARRYLYAANMNLAQQAWRRGNVANVLRILDQQRPRPGEVDLRGFGWHYLWDLCHRDGRVLRGHQGGVFAVACSPDGQTAASGGEDRIVRLWRLADAKPLASLDGHGATVLSVAFSPDGAHLASADAAGRVFVWDVASRRLSRSWTGHEGGIECVAFSPNGRELATGGFDRMGRVWNAATGRQRIELAGHDAEVDAVLFTTDGTQVITGSSDRTVRVWDAATGKQARTIGHHADTVHCIALSPDGKTLATSMFYDPVVQLWDMTTGRLEGTLRGHRTGVHCLAYSPDGRFLATASPDSTVKVWEVASRNERTEWKGHRERVRAVAFSGDGRSIVSGSIDGTVRIWDVVAGQEFVALTDHRDRVCAVDVVPGGRWCASADAAGQVRLWDLNARTTKSVLTMPGRVDGLSFSPDGTALVAACRRGTVALWDVPSARQIDVLQQADRYVRSVAYSQDGRYIAVGRYDHTVRLWDLARGRQAKDLRGHPQRIYCVAFSPDSRILASGDWGGNIKLWDVAAGEERSVLPRQAGSITCVAFAPDGHTLATSNSDDQRITVWSISTQRREGVLIGHRGHVFAIAYAPNGELLASAGEDNTIRLWDTKTHQPQVTLEGHRSQVMGLAFSSDGHTLVSASYDQTIRIWRLSRPDARDGLEGP